MAVNLLKDYPFGDLSFFEIACNLSERNFTIAYELDGTRRKLREASDAFELLREVINDLTTDHGLEVAELAGLRDHYKAEAGRWEGLYQEADREAGQFRGSVRDQLLASYQADEISREAANEILEALKLAPIVDEYRAEVTITITYEGLRSRDGHDVIEAAVRAAVDADAPNLPGFVWAYSDIRVEDVELEESDVV
ncbi:MULTISPECIES: hypothetical protein [Streptomyces]|uniref:hypothetical protein n=1 Tax=Streptomyces TaxID=1883 RepID=UPI002270AAF4|nr:MULTISPECIES: hypothetical protein [unclassified Streptomyces]MCY0921679.1 hypothetical protein [Streptomyces sp. H27-G5]MCY0944012.1 hypothetical protein [Streptomyces sp. H34-AA3]MCY0956268.1 hypothetical protein [Streptomyces sp. H27-H5]MCZ4082288.1 hypothetical protein [Streptomyces sp. H34-S5]